MNGLTMLVIIIGAPALYPRFTLGMLFLIWPIIYIGLVIYSIFYGMDNSLPLYVTKAGFGDVIVAVAALSLCGFVAGPHGYVLAFLFYLPAFMIPVFLVVLGIGVQDTSWWTYLDANYNPTKCNTSHLGNPGPDDTCIYVPKDGKHLPTFMTDYKDKVTKVIPYGQK